MKDDRIMKRLPERELEIMQIIWRETPPVSRMTVEDALQKAHSLAPTTILTLLTRLCGKGFLSMEKDGRMNLYVPLISEKEYLAAESRAFLDRLFHGSWRDSPRHSATAGLRKRKWKNWRSCLRKESCKCRRPFLFIHTVFSGRFF